MHEALCRSSGTTLDSVHAEDGPPITQRTSGLGGIPVVELCASRDQYATFYTWRTKYGGAEVSDARRLKALEDENCKLKKLLAESMLNVATLREALGENF